MTLIHQESLIFFIPFPLHKQLLRLPNEKETGNRRQNSTTKKKKKEQSCNFDKSSLERLTIHCLKS